jgi:hypothetical protein
MNSLWGLKKDPEAERAAVGRTTKFDIYRVGLGGEAILDTTEPVVRKPPKASIPAVPGSL